MKKIDVSKFVKNYKFQVVTCAAAILVAILSAIVGHAAGSETTRTALRIYFVINPAVIIAAIPLETLAVVSPVFMDDRSPKVFFESAATTSVIATAICVLFAATAEKKDLLMATVTLPYCVVVTVAMLAGFAACAIRDRKNGKATA